MGDSSTTCWTVIRGAAAGEPEHRETFARYYRAPVRAYFGARWRGSPHAGEVEDATQEVFFECFRGVLERADPARAGGFRALLYGVARNVARRFEERRARRREVQPSSAAFAEGIASAERSLSHAFDRAWAESMVAHARERQEQEAARAGDEAQRRVELLRLRFEEGEPIRAIAARWGVEPQWLHNQFAKARREFRAALLDVVRFHHPGPGAEEECARLLRFFE